MQHCEDREMAQRVAKLAEFYKSRSAVLEELEYLRIRWPRLDTEEQRRENLSDRAALNRLLLRMT